MVGGRSKEIRVGLMSDCVTYITIKKTLRFGIKPFSGVCGGSSEFIECTE